MEPPSSPVVTVLNQTDYQVEPTLIERAVRSALTKHRLYHAEATVLLSSDEDVQRLNRTFRQVDEPTDVLTFPADDETGSGDVAIAVPYAVRQAAVRGVTLEQEIAYLAIHGALHLAGLDDESETERREMVLQMNEVASELGLPEDHEWGSLLHEVGS